MVYQENIEIFLEVSSTFHNQIKSEWKTLYDYRQKGKEWINSIKLKYHNSDVTVFAFEILQTEIFHFLNVSGSITILPENNSYKALIMKGGGIKGLAYVGALEEITKFYKFNWYAGTSAGAIAAVLLGADYSIDELKKILSEKNFKDFKDASLLKGLLNLISKKGVYEANTFTSWLDNLLAKKLESTVAVRLAHLPNRTSIYACRRDKDALIFDSHNAETKNINAAFAARCSMSIPLIFTPQKSEGLNVFDGGARNNFPVELLLKDNPNTDFIGLYLGDEIHVNKKNSTLGDIFKILTESSESETLENYKEHIIVIDPSPISTLKFKLTNQEKDFLLECGRLAAIKFLIKKEMIENVNYDIRKEKLEIQRMNFKKRILVRNRNIKITLLILLLGICCWYWNHYLISTFLVLYIQLCKMV